MFRKFFIHISLLVLFVLLQALLFQNMQLSSLHLQPFVFLMIIMIFPFDFPKWLLLLLAFFSGLTLDIFNDSLGLNAATLTFITYLRPVFLGLISPYDGYDNTSLPRIRHYGFLWVFKYTSIYVFSFSIVYYFLVSFSFEFFFTDIAKAFLGGLYTIIIILLLQFAFFKN